MSVLATGQPDQVCDHLHIYNVWPVFTNANGKQRNESFLPAEGAAQRELREESQGLPFNIHHRDEK